MQSGSSGISSCTYPPSVRRASAQLSPCVSPEPESESVPRPRQQTRQGARQVRLRPICRLAPGRCAGRAHSARSSSRPYCPCAAWRAPCGRRAFRQRCRACLFHSDFQGAGAHTAAPFRFGRAGSGRSHRHCRAPREDAQASAPGRDGRRCNPRNRRGCALRAKRLRLRRQPWQKPALPCPAQAGRRACFAARGRSRRYEPERRRQARM